MNWKFIEGEFDDDMRRAMALQHLAVQFIAVTGRHIISQREDDSNTSMQYRDTGGLVTGEEIVDGIKLGLNISDLTLGLVNNEKEWIDKFEISGYNGKDLFKRLHSLLSLNEINISRLKPELHYDIPSGEPFSESTLYNSGDISYLNRNNILRGDAQFMIDKVIATIPNASEVRIWPHHFDTGATIPTGYNSRGEISTSVGLGFAIPDSIADKPYFYVSFWSEQQAVKMDNLPNLKDGVWLTDNWKGSILTYSDIEKYGSPNQQSDSVTDFFTTSLDFLLAKK